MRNSLVRGIFAGFALIALFVSAPAIALTSKVGDFGRNHDNWRRATSAAAWDARFGHMSVLFDGRVWVMGGYTNDGPANDIWFSQKHSGSSWSKINASDVWSPRVTAATVIFDHHVWVMGGFGSDFKTLNDVWRSTNGNLSKWSKVPTENVWPRRQGLAAAVLNVDGSKKIFVSGGFSGNDTMILYNDVWSSPDGENWTQVTANAPWAGRRYHQMVSFNGKLWVIGGIDKNNHSLNDVWSSPDGENWTQVTANAPWAARGQHQVVIGNGRMWLTGGTNGPAGSYFNDAWSSPDGENWTQVTANAPWEARSYHTSVFVDGKVWVMGGGRQMPAYNDVWKLQV